MDIFYVVSLKALYPIIEWITNGNLKNEVNYFELIGLIVSVFR